jgi:hypothetical protein
MASEPAGVEQPIRFGEGFEVRRGATLPHTLPEGISMTESPSLRPRAVPFEGKNEGKLI